jgi:hypothetical protein
MATPAQILQAAKDLLRIPDEDTTSDVRLASAYQRALMELTRESDLFTHIQQIPTVAEQAKYTAAPGTTRILAVLHDRTLLMLAPSRSLDLLTDWQNEEPGEPEEWLMDKISGSSSPLEFAIRPRPESAGSGDAGLTLIRIGTPVNDDPPKQCYPFLLFKTLAIYTTEDTEDHDTGAATLFDALASVWRELT